ncbi:hypothetical protein SAMN05428981_101735 [Bacillus sp. OV194]|nr:hypothetical protein SAMN05428981_101735 [Bacillus sp. OV194]
MLSYHYGQLRKKINHKKKKKREYRECVIKVSNKGQNAGARHRSLTCV